MSITSSIIIGITSGLTIQDGITIANLWLWDDSSELLWDDGSNITY